MPARRTNPLPDAPKPAPSLTVVLTPDDPRRLARVGGQFDEHLRQIERQLGIRINNRGNRFELVGADSAAERGRRVLEDLFDLAETEELDRRARALGARRAHACRRARGDGGRRRPRHQHAPPRRACARPASDRVHESDARVRSHVRHRPRRHRQDVSRGRRGRRGARERRRAPHRARAAGRRGRRAPRASCPATSRRRSIRICGRCTTRSTR